MMWIFEIFNDYTFRLVTCGTFLLGVVSGTLGSFAVLRKESLLGDAISHAALPGIGLAFILFSNKHPLILIMGAFVSGWIGTLLMMLITRSSRIKKDAALGMILSVFFGFGLVLLTLIQRFPSSSKSGLDTFLFGNAATLLAEDVKVIMGFGIFALVVVGLCWKEFKLITFDVDFAEVVGYPVKRLEVLLTTLLVIAIVMGLQTVGVVLMSALIIAPASAARQWTDRLDFMVVISALIGGISGALGSLLSSQISHLPTGPTIVLIMSVFVAISLLFSPNRGLVFSWIRHQKNRKTLKAQTLLSNLLLLSESHQDLTHAHNISVLESVGGSGLNSTMLDLERKGYVYSPEKNFWGLTQKGMTFIKKRKQVKKDESSTN